MNRNTYFTLKRVLDISLSLLVLAVAGPFLALIAVWIVCDSRGPVFYRGARVGKNGKPFRMLKFRTMKVDADQTGGSSTPENDSRITRAGKILRQYKLDELPQFWNVLKGEMSLVGPRPQVAWAVALYAPHERQILNLTPGITDYASIRFRNEAVILKGSLDPDKDYFEKIAPEKIRLELEYVRHCSLREDFKILLATFLTVLGKDGAEISR